MIEVDRVSKIHRQGQLDVAALREMSCTIPDGSFTFILGPSGSGKSTLLYLLGGLDEPTTGEVRIGGRSLQTMSSRDRDRFRRNDVGFVFQNFNLLANLTAVDNVLVPFLPQGVSVTQRQRARELLDRLGLATRMEHRPNQLSGGEQQRVAIARALLKQPQLILADEPTGELDTENSAAILGDLRRMCEEHKTTIVVVTHEQEHLRPGDTVIRIRDGRVVDHSQSVG
ncbi:MAG: ABC transporter ATP-binding protein [Planctomycetaceae bacterium]|nr:ABC transporter ATP-binding protein [Planctomycetaceae bacterium]